MPRRTATPVQNNTPSTDEIEDVLVEMLAYATDKPAEHWREVIGRIEPLPLVTNVLCNWAVHPKGSKDDLDAIEKAVELVRPQYPYVG